MFNERQIYATFDNDGVICPAFPPIKTTMKLIGGRLELPSNDCEIEKRDDPLFVRVIGPIAKLIDAKKVPKSDVNWALEAFRTLGEQFQRRVTVAMLSGREHYKHQYTRAWLQKFGLLEIFDDLYLNEGYSSSGWKARQVKRLAKEGAVVVHTEDDLYAALRVARLDAKFQNQILVYLVRNPSNHPKLLQRAGIVLPSNVRPVDTLTDVVADLRNRLELNLV